MNANVVDLTEHRREIGAPPVKVRTILDWPVKRVVRTLPELVSWCDELGLCTDRLAAGHTATAKTAALLYLNARQYGVLITPEAMPEVTHIGWVNRWATWFGPEYPLSVFLPFIVKGRT